MLEVAVGISLLFFGWLCLDHARRVRARYSAGRPPRSPFHGPKPLMLATSALGAFLVLDGLALLALAASARLRLAAGPGDFVSLEMSLTLAAAAAALILAARWRGGRRKGQGQCPPSAKRSSPA